jgi:hypothetical protein
MSLIRTRQFLLGAYHDLPNVLFVGSLLLGSIAGYLPLVWVAVGMIFNGLNVAVVQALLGLIFPLDPKNPGQAYSQVWQRSSESCGVLFPDEKAPPKGIDATLHLVAPSYWIASALFFATFSIYNSIRVALRPKVKGAKDDKADVRRALTMTTVVVGFAFFGLVLLRGFTQCETVLGGILGSLIGIGSAIGFWHILDVCGTGVVPDVLQVVNSLPPPGQTDVPVVCAPDTSN